MESYRSVANAVYARAAGYSGLNLSSASSFSGNTAVAAAKEFFGRAFIDNTEHMEVSLAQGGAMIIRRVGSGDTEHDFELSADEQIGPIRDVGHGLLFTFSKYKHIPAAKFRPACAEASLDRRLAIIKWKFPAMRHMEE